MDAHRIHATTLGDLLLIAADRFGDRDCLIFPDRRVTYAEMADAAYGRARSLMAAGVGRGDAVGILCRGSRKTSLENHEKRLRNPEYPGISRNASGVIFTM